MNLAQKLSYSCLLSLLISPLALAESYQCPNRAQLLQQGEITIPKGWVSEPKTLDKNVYGSLNFTSVELATGPQKTTVSCTYEGRNKGTLTLQAQFPGAQALIQGFEKYWDGSLICRNTNPGNCQWIFPSKKSIKK